MGACARVLSSTSSRVERSKVGRSRLALVLTVSLLLREAAADGTASPEGVVLAEKKVNSSLLWQRLSQRACFCRMTCCL